MLRLRPISSQFERRASSTEACCEGVRGARRPTWKGRRLGESRSEPDSRSLFWSLEDKFWSRAKLASSVHFSTTLHPQVCTFRALLRAEYRCMQVNRNVCSATLSASGGEGQKVCVARGGGEGNRRSIRGDRSARGASRPDRAHTPSFNLCS